MKFGNSPDGSQVLALSNIQKQHELLKIFEPTQPPDPQSCFSQNSKIFLFFLKLERHLALARDLTFCPDLSPTDTAPGQSWGNNTILKWILK